MRATSETQAPGSSDAATSRSFSSCDHRRRRSTDVITSALELVIALLLGLPLGPAAFASVKQGGPQRRNTFETPYRLRKQVVEPVFGQIKQARGFRQFLLRGIEKVRAEWARICT